MIMLVTDSTAYLSRLEAQALGIVQVPTSYTVRGGAPNLEGYMDEEAAMVPTVAATADRCTTAQASYADYMSALAGILEKGNQALVLTISSRLSGGWANARRAAKELGEDNVAVVDSKTTAGALYLLLKKARSWIDEGHPLKVVAQQVREAREKTCTYFSVEDMSPLRRSGRLGHVRLSVSTILNIRPILKLTGGVVNTWVMARGRQDQLRLLEEAAANCAVPVVVQHCLAGDMADQLTRRLNARGIPVIRRLLGPVLTVHLGGGCLSVAWLEG